MAGNVSAHAACCEMLDTLLTLHPWSLPSSPGIYLGMSDFTAMECQGVCAEMDAQMLCIRSEEEMVLLGGGDGVWKVDAATN